MIIILRQLLFIKTLLLRKTITFFQNFTQLCLYWWNSLFRFSLRKQRFRCHRKAIQKTKLNGNILRVFPYSVNECVGPEVTSWIYTFLHLLLSKILFFPAQPLSSNTCSFQILTLLEYLRTFLLYEFFFLFL